MKTIFALLIAWTLGLTSYAYTDAMLCGIRIVETQDQLHPPRGKLGERGPYQFRRTTWRMHTSSSFDLAENRSVANTVAKRHYAWIEAQLKANGVAPSEHNVAMAWNAGVNAVIRGRVPAVARDYANRVVNIASSMPEPASTPEPDTQEMLAEAPPAPQTETPATAIVAAAPAAADIPVSPAPNTDTAAPASTAASDVVPTEYVYTVPPSANDPIQVRFHTSPIMLAFSRPSTPENAPDNTPEPVKETAPVQVAAADTVSFSLDALQTVGRM